MDKVLEYFYEEQAKIAELFNSRLISAEEAQKRYEELREECKRRIDEGE